MKVLKRRFQNKRCRMNIRTDQKRNHKIVRCNEKSPKARGKISCANLLVLQLEQRNYKTQVEKAKHSCSNFVGYLRNNEIDNALTYPYIEVQILSL